MPLNWMDVSKLSFHHMLLLEEIQLSWLPGWIPEQDLRLALQANPVVEWYMRHKCPRLNDWLDRVMALPQDFPVSPEQIRQAEVNILQSMEDLLVYAIDPAIYDAQPFLCWDDGELLSLVDFSQKQLWMSVQEPGGSRLPLPGWHSLYLPLNRWQTCASISFKRQNSAILPTYTRWMES